MKNTFPLFIIGLCGIWVIIATFAFVGCNTAKGQGIEEGIGTIASNLWNGGVASAFYGQKLTDPKTHCYGGIYGYNITQSTNSANAYVVMGIDHLWSTQPHAADANFTLSGGVTLDTKDYVPADWFGVTNSWLNKISIKGFGAMLVGSPTSGGASLMNVDRIGGYVSIHDWNVGKFVIEPDIGLAYGNREGVNSTYNGNWFNVFAAITIHSKKP